MTLIRDVQAVDREPLAVDRFQCFGNRNRTLNPFPRLRPRLRGDAVVPSGRKVNARLPGMSIPAQSPGLI